MTKRLSGRFSNRHYVCTLILFVIFFGGWAEAMAQNGTGALSVVVTSDVTISSEVNTDLNALSAAVEPASRSEAEVFTETYFHGRSPLGALLRSFVMPGWGHYYADSDSWRRGQFHLAAEVALAASYLGLNRQAYVLEKNMYTHASAFSGVDIQGRDRNFELAVGNFRSLYEYNDYQERTRNLNRLYPDTPEYRWEWESDAIRREYRDLRSRRDNLNQQLPTLAAFMVANRILSGINAYNRARSVNQANAGFSVGPGPDLKGFEARVYLPF